jgi:transposase
MNYIGCDCHISTLDCAVVNEKGHETRKQKMNTGVKELMGFVKNIPKPRKIIIEEGTLANWLLEVCTDYGEKLIITDPKTNRWIGRAGQKNDTIDATKLAHLARGGYIKEIHHPIGHRRRFRELVLSYHDTVKSQTRIKNKLKAKFRQNGIQCTGETVYSNTCREKWKKKLPQDKIVQIMVAVLWQQLDHVRGVREELFGHICKQSRQYPEIKRFKQIPGIGPIHAATISAIVENPHRFANKKKLWMYAGFGLAEKVSGEKVYSKNLTRNYNRLLKSAFKQAAGAAINARDNQFRRQYLRLTIVQGIASHRAKLTVARSMLAAVYGMWKSGEAYDPHIDKRQTESDSTRVRAYHLVRSG